MLALIKEKIPKIENVSVINCKNLATTIAIASHINLRLNSPHAQLANFIYCQGILYFFTLVLTSIQSSHFELWSFSPFSNPISILWLSIYNEFLQMPLWFYVPETSQYSPAKATLPGYYVCKTNFIVKGRKIWRLAVLESVQKPSRFLPSS